MRLRLRTRIDLMVSLVLLAMFLSVVYLSAWRQNTYTLEGQRVAVDATASALAKALKSPLNARDYRTAGKIADEMFQDADLDSLHLTDASGRVLLDLQTGVPPGDVPHWFKRLFAVPALAATRTIALSAQGPAVIRVTRSSEPLYASLWNTVRQLGLVAVLAYLMLSVGMWWMLRRNFRPLELLQQAAEKLGHGIHQPIDDSVAPELKLPIRAFNQMSQQIAELIGQLKDRQAELQISAQTIDSLSEGVFILRQDLSMKYFNPFGARLTDAIPNLLDTLSDILRDHLSGSPGASLHLAADIDGGKGHHALDILINDVPLASQGSHYYVIVVRDMTEERAHKTRLAWEATHDTLTGTPNRHEFARRLNEYLCTGQAGMLLFIDLDHFKQVNDSHGHSVGDLLLKHIADGLQRKLGDSTLLARFGGDEFLVLLKQQNFDEASRIAESLVAAIPAMKFLHQGQMFSVTASIGGIYFDADTHLSAEMLISHTDATMFEAKRAGRNRFAIFAHEMPQMERIKIDHEWVDRLTTALEHDLIVPHFQPILRLADGCVSHFEALARLRLEEKTLQGNEFVPHAERLGLIGEIDVVMLRAVLRTLSTDPSLVIATNLSGYTLNNRYLKQRLFEVLEAYSGAASRLIIEITESTAIEEIGDAKAFIQQARAKGCRFAIDDFGVGYSSLQTLSQLEVDYLKIDGSLLAELHSENTALLRAVQGLADALQIPTVAEHVDSEEKLEAIRRIGIHYAQGFWVGRAGQSPALNYP